MDRHELRGPRSQCRLCHFQGPRAHEKDVERFKDGLNFRKLDQQRVGAQFAAILSMMRETSFSTEGLFVFFCSFEPAAITDANENVTEQQVEQLKNKLANKDLWTISRLFHTVAFLFFTDAQAAKYGRLRETYLQEYLRLVEPYDEFGYVKKRGLTVRFDSKENFDTNYQSNWYYYYH
jgi:hypothetical protein